MSGWWEWVIMGLLIFLVACLLFIFLGNIDKNPIYSIKVVSSDSMKPVFATGDMIIISKTDKQVTIGDIISFVGANGETLTHRVIGIEGTTLITKGDNSEDEDVWPNGWSLQEKDICGWYLFKIPKIGYFFNWFNLSRAQLTDKEKGSIGIEAGIFTPTPTLEPTPTPTLEPSLTPEVLDEGENTPTPSPENSDTPAPPLESEDTPTPSPDNTPSPTPTPTNVPDPTVTPSSTATDDLNVTPTQEQ